MSGWYYRLLEKLHLDRRDVTLSVASLLLAFIVWLLYNLSLNYSTVLKAQVICRSNLPGYSEMSSDPVIIEARCRTTGFRLINSARSSGRSTVKIDIDSELLQADGEGSFSITANELSRMVGEIFGDEVRLESFLSPSYTFHFLAENHKLVRVVPVEVITCKPQYMEVGEMALTPDSVLVYGEPSHLENLDFIRTERIVRNNVSSPLSGNIRLHVPDNLRVSENSVDYFQDVSRYVEIETPVEVKLRNLPHGKNLALFPSAVTALIRCSFPTYGGKAEDLEFFVDYNEFLRSSNGHCVVRTDSLPAGILDVRLKPEIIECVETVR